MIIKHLLNNYLDMSEQKAKVCFVGHSSVGKTCLIKRFVEGVFDPDQGATVAFEAIDADVEVDG